MKNKSIYPWVVVGLLWIVALLNFVDLWFYESRCRDYSG
jgi:hypothetical protein